MTPFIALGFILLIAAWVASSVAVSIAEYRLAGLKAKANEDE